MRQTFNNIIDKIESWFRPKECTHLWVTCPNDVHHAKCELCGEIDTNYLPPPPLADENRP